MKKILVALLFTTSAFAQDITPEAVLNKYFDAIGGKEKISQIKDMTMEVETDAMGQQTNVTIIKKNPNKLYQVVSMGGMEFQKILFDGEKLTVTVQGNEIPTNEQQVETYKNQAQMTPEMGYFNENVKLKMLPNEKIKGEDCYVMEITSDDISLKDFYSVASGLKLSTEIENQGMTIVTNYSDYQEFEGVKFPMKMEQEVMGMTIESKVTVLKVNSGVSDDTFK